jgi:hypothetical protein
MKKTLLYRLFKVGAIPAKLKPVLDAEGMVVCDEGISVWLIMKNVRAPGKRFIYRMMGFSGFLAITRKRVIAYAYGRRLINIDVHSGKLAAVQAAVKNSSRLELTFESSIFRTDWSGAITLRFNTLEAKRFYDALINAREALPCGG